MHFTALVKNGLHSDGTMMHDWWRHDGISDNGYIKKDDSIKEPLEFNIKSRSQYYPVMLLYKLAN